MIRRNCMKKRRKKTSHRFRIPANQYNSWESLLDLEPEVFAVYVRRAEKLAIPTIKEKRLSPAAAQLVLSQHAKVLATGDSRLTDESIVAISNRVLALWQAGYYTPGPDYPFTFEETLQEIRAGAKPKEDYSSSIQPYTPIGKDIPRSTIEVAGGIVNTIRQGTTIRKAYALYRQLLSEADGEAKQLPYDMLLYLGEHCERFMIKL
jgi:hypothetical protein